MKTTNKIPRHFEPSSAVNSMTDVHVEVYSKSASPVAVVLWRGNDAQPFMALKDSGDGSMVRFSVTANDDVPAHDSRTTHLNTKIEVLLKGGEEIAGLAVTGKGESSPKFVFVGNDEDVKQTPTNEQLEAVAKFKEANGRSWKTRLNECWLRASYPGTTPGNAALLQQVRNWFGPEWLTKSATEALKHLDQQPQVELLMVLTFDIHDAQPLLPQIEQAASHIPKYWDVSESERQQIARLFAEPLVQGGSVRFGASYRGQKDDLTRLTELAQELGKKLHDKKFVIEGGESIHCLFASGGLKEDVVAPENQTQQIAGSQYLISINRERWDAPARASGAASGTSVELDRVLVSAAALVGAAERFGIDELATPDIEQEYVWFKSRDAYVGDNTTRHTLHVHEIDGREPQTRDYRTIAARLGVDVDMNNEAGVSVEALS